MKAIEKLKITLALLATIALMNGCATSQKPDFQGYKHSSPTVQDYYPRENK